MEEGNGQAVARHAVVTGTSSGIGRAIAERLLDAGWRVTGFDRTPAAIAHPGFVAETVDLVDRDETADRIRGLSGVTALVHAAGFMRTAALGDIDTADGESMWRLHAGVATQLADALAPGMPAGGRILLIGSRTAAGAAARSQYAATKAALVGLARSWAIELAPRRITVNVIAPAATDTPFLRDPDRSGVPPKVPPIGRFVQASEVAALAAFLLSPDAAAITGQAIVMCGGASL
jgi:NAD(P)-dependent dehydrogenase (short-subunit alcohol dehydrogenase family)